MAGNLAGRLSKLFVGTVGSEVSTAGALTDGLIYFVSKIAVSGSGIPDGLAVGDAFIADSVTLVEGDGVYPLGITTGYVGIVKDKGVSASKGTIDMTADEDGPIGKKISNMLSSTSVSFSGNNSAKSAKKMSDFERVFNTVIVGDGEAGYTVKTFSDDPIWLVFDYTARDRAALGDIKMFVVPALLTSLNINTTPDGGQDFSADGESAGSDDLGNKQTMIYSMVPAA